MDIAAVVGLGNPGAEHAPTRHSVGFMVVDEMARRWRLTGWRHRDRSLMVRRAGGRPTLLVKPQTYMNLSGDAVALLCAQENLDSAECLVVVDDVELPLGQLRLRESGGPGTHNGLRSIVDAIGEGFPRLRLGICGEHPWDDLAEYVLTPFDDDEKESVATMVKRAADCIEATLRVGIVRAASQFNQAASAKG
jgi:PTH1 family peptidyl-tRNA hydrolase